MPAHDRGNGAIEYDHVFASRFWQLSEEIVTRRLGRIHVIGVREPIDILQLVDPETKWLDAFTAYDQAIARIKSLIAEGRTYQVNYTYRLRALFEGHPTGIFLDLIQAQESAYAAYLDVGPYVICSASPELFLLLAEQEAGGR